MQKDWSPCQHPVFINTRLEVLGGYSHNPYTFFFRMTWEAFCGARGGGVGGGGGGQLPTFAKVQMRESVSLLGSAC